MRLPRDAEDSFRTHSYPTTTAEFVAEHGDVEIELPEGSVALGEVLETMPNEQLATEEEARLSTYSAFGEAAIGRKGYSDRDPTTPGEDGPSPVSL